MAITKISNSGILTGTKKYDSMLAGNAAYDPAATWLIERVAGTGSSGTITFSNIPQNYQHLQVRYNLITTTGSVSVFLRLNGDTGSNYVHHFLYGNGTTASAFGATARSDIRLIGTDNGTSTTQPSTGIVDIHDYTSTTKNKTVRNFSGVDKNGSGEINLISGLWLNTAAVNSITIYIAGANNFTTTSTFALYEFIGA